MIDRKSFYLLALLAAGCQESVPTQQPAGEPAPVAGQTLVALPEVEVVRANNPALDLHAANGAIEGSYLTHRARIVDGAASVVPSSSDGARTVLGDAVTFKTTRVERDGKPLINDIADTKLSGATVALKRPSFTESFTNREEGLEQTWSFADEPTGEGDLEIRVAVSGYTSEKTTDTGIHLATSGALGLRYSHGVWIDSAGEATNVPATWDNGSIVLRVPADTLARTSFPAVLDPTVGAESGVDAPVNGYTGQVAREVAVSYSGSTWLAVWRDNRQSSTDSDIYAARIASDGTVLDQFGLKINDAAGSQTLPTVTFANNRWVVAWEINGDIAAATVSTAGMVTQLGTVSAGAGVETAPRLASRGTDALLVWQSDADVLGARFGGTAFGAAFPIAATANPENDPTIAANPNGEYLVAWSEGATAANVRGQFVTATGSLDGTAFDIDAGNGNQLTPSAAFTGTDFLVAFVSNGDIYGTRVTTAGAVLDTHLESMATVGGAPISQATGNQVTPAVACDASACFVTWSDRRAVTTNGADIYGQSVSFAFALQGGEVAISTPARQQTAPAIAAGSSGYFTAWSDDRTGGSSAIIGSRLGTGGAVTDPAGIVLSRNRNGQFDPAFARGPSFQLAVWSDSRTFGNDIMGVRYDDSSARLDTVARDISNGAANEATPTASWDGTQFVVAWDDARGSSHDIYATRFSTAGAPLDGAGIAVTTAANDQLVPDVASGAGVSLIVWQDRRNAAASNFDIYGALVDASGAVTVSDIPICTVTGDQTRPAVAYDATNNVFVVVWSDSRLTGNADIFAARVSTAGAVLDAGGVAVSTAANGQFAPEIAASGSQLLAVWDDRRNDTGDIYGARLTAAGSLGVVDANGISIGAAADSQSSPAVIGMPGGSFAVVWADRRNAGVTGSDIWGSLVTSSGTPEPASAISTGTDDEGEPALQPDPSASTRISLVYQRYRSDLNVLRVVRRGITWEGTQGAACSNDTQCTTGNCVDGFCCDTTCGGSFNTTDCQACSVRLGAAVNGTCAIISANHYCRSSADSFCDRAERCSGTSATCGPDLGQRAGQTCTTSSSTAGVCPPNDATGAPHVCQ